jgi:hypothetical protein
MIKHLTFLIVIVFICTGFMSAQIKNTVTFNADLTDLIADGWNPAENTIRIEGLNWDNGDVQVTGERQLSPDPNNPNIYSTTLEVTSAATQAVGDSARWKFKAGPDAQFVDGGWESDDPETGYGGHAFVFEANDAVVVLATLIPWISFVQTGVGIQNTVTFQADLSYMYGTGVAFFDPTLDFIEIRGFWDGDGNVGATLVSGDQRMQPDPFNATLYTTTLVIELPEGYDVGTTTGWKFKASPDARFTNTGWDITANRSYAFQANGAEVTLDPIQPAISPLGGPLTNDLNVLFQVNLVEGSRNRYDMSLIPRDQVTFVILKGAAAPLGSWQGNWTAADTIAADTNGVARYDNGTNGDKVAGDYIFSRIVTFPAGVVMQGLTPYKYGASYPGVDVISSGNPLDNAAPSGQDMSFNVQDSDQLVEILDEWPTVLVSVRNTESGIPSDYSLTQNYPNPFNPETMINYSIKEEGMVSLNIYNALGQEVMSLVNGNQSAGNYEVRLDASRLTSGIYFYKLSVNGHNFTKKMMLLK